MPINSFRDLLVWQRSAVSIPSNISEGHMRSTRDFLRFISIALGSAAELETQIVLAGRLKYLDEASIFGLLASLHEVGRMLRGLQLKLREKTL